MSKILVVEDDSATRLLLKRDLQLSGYEVAVAKDGEEGLEQALKIRPALMLCDWMMPLMDGVEVCRRVKATPELASTFFILLTARDSVEDRVEGLDAGADDFIAKPIEANELLARVRSGLRVYQYQQQLSEANQQLSQTLQELKHAQAQLVQSEKMSSLGQMVAGIVHEINNPITFISGNLDYTTNYIHSLLGLMQLYQKHYPKPHSEIEEAAEDIDWEFLITDLPKSWDSMKAGASRIGDIVRSLKNFSRLDQAEMKPVNLHEGIDNALVLLDYRLSAREDRPVIQVIKEYSDLPLVECCPSQINQVFLNLIDNAIDVLEQKLEETVNSSELGWKDSEASPTIWIRTKLLDNDRVEIAIADNGMGMNPDVVRQIFNPFFTTKPVGKGTGLGLAIAHSVVVDQHNGRLECNSTKGEGTEFSIQIPTRQDV